MKRVKTKPWKPYDPQAIANSVGEVFQTGNVGRLSDPARNFINRHMLSFTYGNLDLLTFAVNLQEGELKMPHLPPRRHGETVGGKPREFFLFAADRAEHEMPREGATVEYLKSVAETMRAITRVAAQAEPLLVKAGYCLTNPQGLLSPEPWPLPPTSWPLPTTTWILPPKPKNPHGATRNRTERLKYHNYDILPRRGERE